MTVATSHFVAETSEIAKQLVDEKLGESAKAQAHMKHAAAPLFKETKKLAEVMGEKVFMVLADSDGNEVGHDRCDGTNILFLKTARGKIMFLKKTNDVSKLSGSVVKAVRCLPGVASGLSKEYPIKGAILIQYLHDVTRERVVGYFSISGTPSGQKDEDIARAAILKFGARRVREGKGSGVIETTIRGKFAFTDTLQDEDRAFMTAVSSHFVAENSEIAKQLVDEKLDENAKAQEHMKKAAALLFEETKNVAEAMGEKVFMVLADSDGNEVGHDRCDGTNMLFLKTARGKITCLQKTNDVSSLSNSVVKTVRSLPGVASGRSKEFPIRGAILIQYLHDVTKERVIGYFSISGTSSGQKDEDIARAAILSFGARRVREGIGAGVIETTIPGKFAFINTIDSG